MENAKLELLRVIKNSARIKCASICYGEINVSQKILKLNYSEQEYNKFLNSLDFNYNNGFGLQELDGLVWLEDNTWLSRGEYDGSEWWIHNVIPDIPIECM